MEKRPAEDEENGEGENGAKKAKLDPECGRLLFCGSTNWEYVNKPCKLKDDFYYSKQNVYEPMFLAAFKDIRIRHLGSSQDAGHVVVVDEDGQAWSWGNNEFGQLGQGDLKNRRVPTPMPNTGPTGHIIVMVALSKRHTLLLTSRGEVLACGDNTDGQCGQGEMKSTTVNNGRVREELETNSIERVLELTPINYSGPPVIKISSGMDFNMLLDVEGCVWTFGSQEFGKCGTGTDGAYNAAEAKVKMRYAGISEPHKITRVYERDAKTKKTKSLQMMRIKSIAAGSHHAAMVDEMSRVFTWGAGSYGRTGLGDTTDTLVPTWVQSLDHPRGKIEEVYCGNMCTVMLGKGHRQVFLAGIVDALKKEANMVPKQYFEFGDAGLRDIGFFKKGWNHVGDDGSVMQTNTGPCYGELGTLLSNSSIVRTLLWIVRNTIIKLFYC
ncbi:protein RCC2 homolog isoform X2 [Eurytemora carolleeae]|uniref:protein RCC2 homolog isoform X2 n=1 Tax=Eurytemora carolleeae TaxID=1294199 RepID=UPI000C761395|nr:protein RCC2 homolog isoform X2 [Eurytemora carolleeae]|eukprot:XP_023340146.1 protein RCC2 homolog isoform X2 [Eurytemora affinis]